jgi:hypothetical protein
MILAFKLVRISGVKLLVLEVHGVNTFYAQTSNKAHKNK